MKEIIFVLTATIVLLTVTLGSSKSYSQNVGIGTKTPTRAKLELHGSVLSTSAIFGGESSGVSLQSNWPAVGFNEYAANGFRYLSNGFGAVQYLNPNDGFMVFTMLPMGAKDVTALSVTNAMIISNTGNTGIRTPPTNATLFVARAGNPDGSVVFGGTSYNSHFNYGAGEDTYIRGGKPGGKLLIGDIGEGKILMGNGTSYVGINNGPTLVFPLEIRQVNGRGLLLVEPANSFNNWEFRVARPSGWTESNLYLIYNGQNKGYFTWGTGAYETFSDRRLKTAITSMPSALNKVMQLEPVDYKMKDDQQGDDRTIGFIAQDVKPLFPELVTISPGTSRGHSGIHDMQGINYNGFIVLSIKALQEQQLVIREMRLQNKDIERRIEKAEAIAASKK